MIVDEREQTERFARDLENLVARYCEEFDLTFATMIGVLHHQAFLLCSEAAAAADEDDGQSGNEQCPQNPQ